MQSILQTKNLTLEESQVNIRIDPHTHTIASGHAYNTIREMALSAAAKGIEYLGITDHGPAVLGSPVPLYFNNLRAVDRTAYGVRLLMGVEANITDSEGTLDLPDALLEKLDLVLFGMHVNCYEPNEDRDANTRAAILAMRNPRTMQIVHPDDGKYPIHAEELVKAAVEHRVIIELNNCSMIEDSYRLNGRENSREILKYCEKYGAEIIMSSDAHFETGVGDVALSEALAKEIGFPEALILNNQPERFFTYLNR